jgi:hypothetical protein
MLRSSFLPQRPRELFVILHGRALVLAFDAAGIVQQ